MKRTTSIYRCRKPDHRKLRAVPPHRTRVRTMMESDHSQPQALRQGKLTLLASAYFCVLLCMEPSHDGKSSMTTMVYFAGVLAIGQDGMTFERNFRSRDTYQQTIRWHWPRTLFTSDSSLRWSTDLISTQIEDAAYCSATCKSSTNVRLECFGRFITRHSRRTCDWKEVDGEKHSRTRSQALHDACCDETVSASNIRPRQALCISRSGRIAFVERNPPRQEPTRCRYQTRSQGMRSNAIYGSEQETKSDH
jgi:hypothetical protein